MATALKSLGKIVDRLGQLKAEVADLKVEEEKLKEQLMEAEVEEVDGKQFRVTVSRYQQNSTDYKGLVESLVEAGKIKQALLDKFTTMAERTKICVNARK